MIEIGEKEMGLLHEMQNITDYKEREHDICQYILQHPEEVASLSSRKLGELTFTSAATVTRFCQKLGCKGYPDFKLRFLSELKYHDTPEKEEEISISEKESVVTMLRKVEETYKRAIQETKDMLSLEQMMRIRKLVRQAEYIDFYVYDANVALAMYARNLLFHSGKVANVYSETNIQELNALVSREKHLAIIISRTGENARLVEVAKTLKRSKTKTIIITCGKERTLGKMGDERLYTMARAAVDDFGTVLFSTGVKYLLDVIFGMEFSYQYKENILLNQTYEERSRDRLWTLINQV